MNVTTAILIGSIALCGAARGADMPPAVQSLADAERAFAATSLKSGTRAAFLAYLAPNGKVFDPGPTNGIAVYEKREPSSAVLSWEPAYVEIASSGDFGFSTGPWTWRKDQDAQPEGFGHFVSIWEKQADGAWKVAMDVGIDHEKTGAPATVEWRASSHADPGEPDPKQVTSARSMLFKTDQALARSLTNSAAYAYGEFGAEDLRLYRMGAKPIVGREAAQAAAGDAALPGSAEVVDAQVAKSFDLGYTHGFRRAATGVYYLRIWRLNAEDVWELVLDLESPANVE
jgi:ketosteroid isomerase-like protein